MRSRAAGIGETARRFGTGAHVLRRWEACGLLSPPRDASGRRRYGEEDRVRIAAVQLAKEAGLTLEAIRALLTSPAPETRRAELLAHREALRERVARASAELELVESALGCEHEELTRCPRFRARVDARVNARAGHRSGA